MNIETKNESVGITGLVVLGGRTSVQNPTANFHNAFQGTTNSGYGVGNALVKIIFSYQGYANAFNVVNEVKVFPRMLAMHTQGQALIDA